MSERKRGEKDNMLLFSALVIFFPSVIPLKFMLVNATNIYVCTFIAIVVEFKKFCIQKIHLFVSKYDEHKIIAIRSFVCLLTTFVWATFMEN